MLYCEQCDRGFHIYCLGIKAVPEGKKMIFHSVVHIDSNFGFHSDYIKSKVYFILRKICSSSFYFPTWVKIRTTHTFLMPQILYVIEVSTGTSEYNLLKWKRNLNSVAKFV